MEIKSCIYEKDYNEVILVEDFKNFRISNSFEVIVIKDKLYLPKYYKFIDPYLLFMNTKYWGEFSPLTQEQCKNVFINYKINYV